MVRVTDSSVAPLLLRTPRLRGIRRVDVDAGRFTGLPRYRRGEAQLELTHNWDPEGFMAAATGHLAYSVENIYAICQADGRRRRDSPPARGR
jgi:hypothetical protein